MTKGEGAEQGPWMFTSAPIEAGTKLLCTMATRTHVLSLKCPNSPEYRDGALVRLLAAAEEA